MKFTCLLSSAPLLLILVPSSTPAPAPSPFAPFPLPKAYPNKQGTANGLDETAHFVSTLVDSVGVFLGTVVTASGRVASAWIRNAIPSTKSPTPTHINNDDSFNLFSAPIIKQNSGSKKKKLIPVTAPKATPNPTPVTEATILKVPQVAFEVKHSVSQVPAVATPLASAPAISNPVLPALNVHQTPARERESQIVGSGSNRSRSRASFAPDLKSLRAAIRGDLSSSSANGGREQLSPEEEAFLNFETDF